jgi:hypothetical protein
MFTRRGVSEENMKKEKGLKTAIWVLVLCIVIGAACIVISWSITTTATGTLLCPSLPETPAKVTLGDYSILIDGQWRRVDFIGRDGGECLFIGD